MANPYGRWVPDSLSASGFRWQRHDEVPATQMLPIIQPTSDIDPDQMPPEGEHAHGGDE